MNEKSGSLPFLKKCLECAEDEIEGAIDELDYVAMDTTRQARARLAHCLLEIRSVQVLFTEKPSS